MGTEHASFFTKATRGIVFEENGLYGIKDIDGTHLYPAEYSYIGKCRDYVLLLKPDGDYCEIPADSHLI